VSIIAQSKEKYLLPFIVVVLVSCQIADQQVSAQQSLAKEAQNALPGIVVQSYPVSIAVNSKTDKIYVANYFSNTISVIDGKTNIIIGNITTGAAPQKVVVSPVLNRIYVSTYNPSILYAIATQTEYYKQRQYLPLRTV
jgi:YVTN family beta-propeller protein